MSTQALGNMMPVHRAGPLAGGGEELKLPFYPFTRPPATTGGNPRLGFHPGLVSDENVKINGTPLEAAPLISCADGTHYFYLKCVGTFDNNGYTASRVVTIEKTSGGQPAANSVSSSTWVQYTKIAEATVESGAFSNVTGYRTDSLSCENFGAMNAFF